MSKVGRPTEYSEDILEKTRLYLVDFKSLEEVIPTVAGLASFLGISRETIYDWASQEQKKEFSDIIDQLKSSQEKNLINSGLKGEFNPTITKVLLAKHGYREGVDVTSDDKPMQGVVFLPKKDDSTLGTPSETSSSTS